MKDKHAASLQYDYLRPNTAWVVKRPAGVCEACGGFGPFTYKPIINDTLAAQWGLSKDEQKAFSARESMFCAFCGCSYRLRALAYAVSLWAGGPQSGRSLQETISQGALDSLQIAEINSCGVLHDIIRQVPHLSYSEYASTNKDIPDEDLMDLSYADNTYDMVLTSDTFEHIPDPAKALREIWRVLKPGGVHIFTVPIRLDKQTKNRSYIDDTGKKRDVAEPSFHGSGEPDYLVQNEFGADFIELQEQVGFDVRVYFQNTERLQDPSCVLVASKSENTQHDGQQRPSERYLDSAYADDTGREQATAALTADGFAPKTINGVTFREDIQLERVAGLANKVALTMQHAANLEAIIDSRDKQIEDLTANLEAVKHTLDAVYNSRSWKLLQRILAVKRVVRKTP